MSSTHLSEIEIQQYLTEEDSCNPVQLQHMQTCEQCRQTAAFYRTLFSGIREQPAATFEFDLETLVLDQLPAKQRKPLYPAIISAVAIITALIYLSRKNLETLIKGLPYLSILLVTIPVAAILIFQCADLWKQYSKKLQQIGTQPV